LGLNAQVQQPSNFATTNAPNSWLINRASLDSFFSFVERDSFPAKYPTIIKHLDHNFYYSNGNGGVWKLLNGGTTDSTIYATIWNARRIADSAAAAQRDSIITAGTISSIPTVGYVAPSNTSAGAWIQNVFYQSQPPTSSLGGGTSLELHSAGTVSETLNWGAGRQAATATLASIVVGGISQSFSQPSQGGTVTGTQSITLTYNTNTTYYNVVTTTDSKSATSSTSFVFYPKLYIGFVPSNSPSDADIIGVTNGNGGVFATNFIASGSLSTPSASKYICIAYPASFGAVNNIVINGLSVTFNLTTRTFVNASGYSQSYNIYLSPNPTSGSVSSYSVN